MGHLNFSQYTQGVFHNALPVNESSWFNVSNCVTRHSISGVLLTADNDSQLIGIVLYQTHHLGKLSLSLVKTILVTFA